MFKPLGLLSSARCPDPSCHRPYCLFAHGEASTATQHRRKSKDTGQKKEVPVKRKVEESPNAKTPADVPAANKEPVKRPKVEERGKGTPIAAVMNSKSIPSKSPAPIKSLPKAPISRPINTTNTTTTPAHSFTNGGTLRPPSIPSNLKRSPQPFADRQKALSTLYQQYSKLYASVLEEKPDLAHTSALAEESDISATAANIRAYKSAIHHAAVAISRRPPPDSINHPSIGTVKVARGKHEEAEKAKASHPTRSRVEGYCLPIDEFAEWRYPDPKDLSLVEGGGEAPDGEGSEQTCNRCKVPFVVSSIDLKSRFGECKFHYGRTAPERVEGRRKWIYNCCGKERGEAGCQDGVHVYSFGDDDVLLKTRKGYRTVKQITDETQGPKGWVDVVAMDCEMISTTAGTSLARATIVNEEGHILLDELVRQTVPILDVNSRFSGIQPGQLDSAVMDLEGVRAAACMFIGPDTIIVGHGLENDLRALRLVHDKVIDTAVLFPHDKGPPFRRALRDIVKEKLGYFIQDRTSDLGHSSAEDAKATLECLKWKIRSDAS